MRERKCGEKRKFEPHEGRYWVPKVEQHESTQKSTPFFFTGLTQCEETKKQYLIDQVDERLDFNALSNTGKFNLFKDLEAHAGNAMTELVGNQRRHTFNCQQV